VAGVVIVILIIVAGACFITYQFVTLRRTRAAERAIPRNSEGDTFDEPPPQFFSGTRPHWMTIVINKFGE
jgi:hypothetical protein